MVRSERSCRLDLRRWGCKFDKNTGRPYWAGHEREDVVISREAFVKKLVTDKDSYYLITEGENPQWIIPKNNPKIFLCEYTIFLTSSSL